MSHTYPHCVITTGRERTKLLSYSLDVAAKKRRESATPSSLKHYKICVFLQ